MYQALYRKWRPAVFSDVVGQAHITDTLRAQLCAGRLSHAYLFTGTRGTGKTTCAKLLARAVNCLSPKNGDPCNECAACLGIIDGSITDVTEIDAASYTGVDNIRSIREEAQYVPASVKKRVYIIDEVHMLSAGAFNALLKTLEEPPEHVLFILATTEVQKLPATVLSRCQRFDFGRIPAKAIAGRLSYIAGRENIPLMPDGAALMARLGDGSMRDALSLLERCSAESIPLDAEAVSSLLGLADSDCAVSILEAAARGDAGAALRAFEKCYADGRDLTSLFDEMLSVIRDVLIIETSAGSCDDLLDPRTKPSALAELARLADIQTLTFFANTLREAVRRVRQGGSARLEAELAIVAICGGYAAPETETRTLRTRRRVSEKDGEQSAKDASKAGSGSSENADGDDAPPWEVSPAPEKPTKKESDAKSATEKPPVSEKSADAETKAPEKGDETADFEKKLVALYKAMQKKLPPPNYIHLTMCKAYAEGKTVVIDAQKGMAAAMLDTPAVKMALSDAVKEIFGQDYSAKIRTKPAFAGNRAGEPESTQRSPLDDALADARKNGVKVEIK